MRRFTVALAVLVALLASRPGENLLADEDDDQRAEARKTIFIEWSRDAKTASLGLDEASTKLVNLYLDYARSSYARRQKRSRQFMGVPHLEWMARDGGLAARAAFVNLELDRADVPAAAVPALLVAIGSHTFPDAVKVDGDDEDLLAQWGVLLAVEIVGTLEEAGRGPDGPAYREAKAAWFTRLLDTFDDTPSLAGRWSRPGTSEDARRAWLQGILVFGGNAAGKALADLRAKLRESGSARDLETATTTLAAASGTEADRFVKAELASGNKARRMLVLRTLGRNASPEVLGMLVEYFLDDQSDPGVAQGALGVLMRAARRGHGSTKKEAGSMLRRLVDDLDKGSKRHADVLFAVVASELADEEVVTLLEASFEQAKEAGANSFVVRRYEGALEAARKQVGG